MYAVERQLALLSPFPAAMHPDADRMHRQTVKWALHYELIASPQDRRHLDASHYTLLMARAYPTADPVALQLIADWNTWTFLLDDYFDEHVIGRDPDAVEHLHQQVLSILAGTTPVAGDSMRIRALHDLASRLRLLANGEWMTRFIAAVRETLAASLWEARNRRIRAVPTADDYCYWRLFTSGVFCYFALIEIAEQMTLPAFVWDHPVIQQLARSANAVICWSNDIFSFAKEVAHGDVHNLVYIVQHERQCALDDAIAYVAQRHDDEVRAFQQLRAALPYFGDFVDEIVQRYVRGLEAWMRANMDWSVATQRYRPIPS
jgi:hypothetical protein